MGPWTHSFGSHIQAVQTHSIIIIQRNSNNDIFIKQNIFYGSWNSNEPNEPELPNFSKIGANRPQQTLAKGL